MREMLRIKRSVQATFNTQVNFMSAQMLSAAVAAAGGVPGIFHFINPLPPNV